MTRDEILAMKPGRELDALVAEKVMGWHWYRPPFETTEGFQLCIPPNFWPYGKDEEWEYTVGGGPYQFVKSYSTDISAAWKVVDHMYENGWYVYIHQNPDNVMPETVRGKAVRISREDARCMLDWVRGESVPEAICKAALLAVIEEGEKRGA